MGQVITEGRRRQIKRVHEQATRHCNTPGQEINDFFDHDGGFRADEYAIRTYEQTGAIAPLSSIFTELETLRSTVPALAVDCPSCDPDELLERALNRLDTVEMMLLGLAAQIEPGLTGDPTESHPQGRETQALLSDYERDVLAGDNDAVDPERARVTARIRRRITDRFADDVAILERHRPKLHDRLEDALEE